MKSIVIVFTFLFITKSQQTPGGDKPGVTPNLNGSVNGEGVVDGSKLTGGVGEGGTPDASKQILQAPSAIPPTTTSNSNETRGPQTLKEKADAMREKAKKNREVALRKAKTAYDQFKEKLDAVLTECDRKEREEIKGIEQEHMKADIIAATIWRNALHTFTSGQKNAEDMYQETVSKINQKIAQVQQTRDAALQAADEQFAKTYAEAEEYKRKAKIEYREALVKGHAVLEDAVKSARQRKTEVEGQFWNTASNYKAITLEQLADSANKYEAELDTYERVLKDAEANWQNILDQVGIGKQYEEALNKAVMDLVNAHRNAVSAANAAMEQLNQDLKEMQTLKTEITRTIISGREKAEKQFKEALNKAKNEAQKKYNIISQKAKRKRALAEIYLKKMQAEYQMVHAEEAKRLDEAMKEALTVESGAEKPAAMKTV